MFRHNIFLTVLLIATSACMGRPVVRGMGGDDSSANKAGGAGVSTTLPELTRRIPLPEVVTMSLRNPVVIHSCNEPTVEIKAVIDRMPSVPIQVNQNCASPNPASRLFSPIQFSDSLQEGSNVFIYEGKNNLGDKVTLRQNLILDTTPPQIEITSPYNGQDRLTNNPSVMLGGSCNADAKVIKGEVKTPANQTIQLALDVNLCSQGSFKFKDFAMTLDGVYEFKVRAEDIIDPGLGEPNFREDTLKLTFDGTPPRIAILNPASSPFPTRQNSFVVSGSCSVDAVNLMTSAGVFTDSNCSDGTWALTLPLPQNGDHPVTVKAFDDAGNMAQASSTLSRVPLPSAVSITPSEGSIVGGTPVVIRGDFLDLVTEVRFESQNFLCRNIQIISKLELRCITPAHPVGLVDVIFLDRLGAVTDSTLDFRYVNYPPVANAVSANTQEDTPVLVRLSYTDLEADQATACSASSAQNGSLGSCSCNAGVCSVQFTPASNFNTQANQSAGFNFTVRAGGADSQVARATVIVGSVDDAPVAQNSTATTNEDTPVSVTLNYTDPDGDLAQTCQIKANSAQHGAVGPCSCANGVCSALFTPEANFFSANSQTAGFGFTVTSNALTSNEAQAIITVRPVNDPPVAENLVFGVRQKNTYSGSVRATDIDGPSALVYRKISDPLHGTLVFNTNGTFQYSPIQTYVGPDSFKFKANDSIADSNEGIVTITVVPSAAVAITYPTNGLVIVSPTPSKSVTIVGTCSPTIISAGLLLSINSAAAQMVTHQCALQGSWTYTTTLNASQNLGGQSYIVSVTASDGVETATASVRFSIRQLNVDVEITSPNGGVSPFSTSRRMHVVSGTCTQDVARIEVLINNVLQQNIVDSQNCSEANGTWSLKSISIPGGILTVAIRGWDATNSISDTDAIVFDRKVPPPEATFHFISTSWKNTCGINELGVYCWGENGGSQSAGGNMLVGAQSLYHKFEMIFGGNLGVDPWAHYFDNSIPFPERHRSGIHHFSPRTPVSLAALQPNEIPRKVFPSFDGGCLLASAAPDEPGNVYCWSASEILSLSSNFTFADYCNQNGCSPSPAVNYMRPQNPLSWRPRRVPNLPSNIRFLESQRYWYNIAVTNDNRLYAWTVTAREGVTAAVEIPTGIPDKIISATLQHPVNSVPQGSLDLQACVTTDVGDVWCIGRNNSKKWNISEVPVNGDALRFTKIQRIPGEGGYLQAAQGFSSMCVLTEAGHIYCQGHNSHGELGNGWVSNGWRLRNGRYETALSSGNCNTNYSVIPNCMNSWTPVKVLEPDFLPGERYVEIKTNGWVNAVYIAKTSRGRLVSWGRNLFGAVGNGLPTAHDLQEKQGMESPWHYVNVDKPVNSVVQGEMPGILGADVRVRDYHIGELADSACAILEDLNGVNLGAWCWGMSSSIGLGNVSRPLGVSIPMEVEMSNLRRNPY